MGTGGGVPIKFDAGARIRDLHESAADYFVADVDTSRGSSGAGAFTQEFALLGILVRGAMDFVDREDGCRATNLETEDHAREHFTYAHRAVSALCANNPQASSLCRPQCGVPCEALPPLELAGGGCTLVSQDPGTSSPFGVGLTMGLVVALHRRRRKQATPASS